jgi:hypothetical protein
MVRVATEVLAGPHYAAVVQRLVAGGIKAAHEDALSPRSLAINKASRGLQKALAARLQVRAADAWKAEGLAGLGGGDFADEGLAWLRSTTVSQPFFGASRADRRWHAYDADWVLAVQLLTRQPALTPAAVGGPLPVDANGQQVCPYETCGTLMSDKGSHAQSCRHTARTIKRHDATVRGLGEIVKKAAGAGVTVQTEPHLRPEAALLGGLLPNAPAVNLRADLRLQGFGPPLFADVSYANPSAYIHTSAAAATDGGAAGNRKTHKLKWYGRFFHDVRSIRPLVVECGGRVVDCGFLSDAAAMATGVVGPGAGGLAYARVLSEMRLRISHIVWLSNVHAARRLVDAVARRVAGGGVAFLPPIGLGGAGGGLGAEQDE